jgi:hypothetical protein
MSFCPVIGRTQGVFTRIDRLAIDADYNTFYDDPQRLCPLGNVSLAVETGDESKGLPDVRPQAAMSKASS